MISGRERRPGDEAILIVAPGYVKNPQSIKELPWTICDLYQTVTHLINHFTDLPISVDDCVHYCSEDLFVNGNSVYIKLCGLTSFCVPFKSHVS